MSAKLQQVEAVAVGHFNPHIISPAWLFKQGIVDEKTAEIEVTGSIPERVIVFQFKIGGYTWRADNNRLVVQSKPTNNPASMVAGVMKKLSHTPVTAIGHNFRYGCERDAWQARVPHLGDIGIAGLGSYGKVQKVAWSAAIGSDKDFVINVQVEETPERVEIAFNFHRVTSDAVAAMPALDHFPSDRDLSKELLRSLVGQGANE